MPPQPHPMNLSSSRLVRIFVLEAPVMAREAYQYNYSLELTGHTTPLMATERLCILGPDIWVLDNHVRIYPKHRFLITVDTLGPIHHILDLMVDDVALTAYTVKSYGQFKNPPAVQSHP